ncbi:MULTISPECIES: hypothetical protein [unclassified Mesorhizobium]|uniref:hypothetical protein n=1 Tax=unclassified Mesorhizobium TaxID=325217 RepID=UPI002416404E|nr:MULTISPECIES: hypothetical protein [unclassified Mesorhizobium]WFP65875.1 hypothetical protein QAZ47_15680 [Mesorhizobium sp. WSM4904]WFP79125.1 hypothetical protein QAZ22_15565 [Mesorhizobium sp. WSM4906]
MTTRIGIATTLKDFTRRDFIASSMLTAVLFTVALLLFPPSTMTDGKRPETIAQRQLSSR